MTNVLEREDKWDVDDQFAMPPLDDVVDGGRVDGDTVDLTSAYYDTPDGDLQAHGVLVRRRDGDDDTGWQLKVPAKGGRTELTWPLSDRPPAELTRLLDGLRLGKELDAVATIRTQRRRYRISVPPERAVYAEIDDDTVRASVGDQLQTWREVEVELGPAADRQPRQLRRRLRAAGASPSRYPSKLVHALPKQPAPESPSPALAMLADYLSAQIDGIVAGDIGLRRGEDPIHDTRVAIRRLRSTLRIFGSQLDLDTDAAADLDEDLRWFAGLLGEVRDCQVQERRFSEALNELSDALVLGPVRARISRDLKAIELPARKSVTEAMETARYRNILGTLRSWRTNFPVKPDAPEKEVRKSTARAARKADRRLDAALTTGDDELLHRARKAAKRARYAAELLGKGRNAKQYKRIQSVLGDHQDTVVATATLRKMALTAGTTQGENGFTFGLLYAREQHLAEECRRAAGRLV